MTKPHRLLPVFALSVFTVALAPATLAQVPPAAGALEPVPAQIGQVSKDSVWVPTPDRLIQRMLQIADTTRNDIVYDLGSGDGRIPIAAAKLFGARAVGVELEKNLVDYSRRSARQQGVAGRVQFLQEDLFKADISKATVFAIYISPSVMERLRPKFYDLRPGTRIVSHHFTLGDWPPDETVQVEERRAYLWVVPSKVEGQWALKLGNDGYQLKLAQSWQMLTASAEYAGRPTTAFAARLRGTEIRFAMIDGNGDVRNFTGKVNGNTMKGEARGYEKPAIAWSAQRLP
jgi:SAM-dependent methyltransferase